MRAVPSSPTTTVRKAVAATKVLTVTNLPLYFKVQSITISARENSSVSGASRVLYQLSGSTDASGASDAKTLGAGDECWPPPG